MRALVETRHRTDQFETAFRKSVDTAGGIEKMLAEGFLQIEYDPSFLAEHVPPILEGLERMTKSDDRDAFAADIFGYDEVGWKHDSGLYRRNEREQKWFFHCYKETSSRMMDRGAPVRKYGDFFLAMDALNRRALLHAQILSMMYDEYHAALGRTLPYSLRKAFENGYSVTRGLAYLERALGKPDATLHFDRDGWTTHWWASRQGLIALSRLLKKIRILEVEFDRICVFGGKKFGGITEYEYGIGLPHGVVDTARESGATDDRFGIVSFVHPTLTPEEAARILAHEPICEAFEQAHAL